MIKGSVLLSYKLTPFRNKDLSTNHTNEWECHQIAQTYLDLGYDVDVIDWQNDRFLPRKEYAFFIDIHSNMERLAPILNKDCVKILHITGAHWLYQNHAEYSRLLDIQRRKDVTLIPRRLAPPVCGIEYADYATILGNTFTKSTFEYAQKSLFRIPISSTITFPWNGNKDFEKCRKSFLWFGNSGMVLKGLDLVLEAFSRMPDFNLAVVGPVKDEKDFESIYHKELYETDNIKTYGWLNVSSKEFSNICNNTVGIIYPSASEGTAGSVVTAMHTGLIPIVSYESGVNVNDFGLIIKDPSIDHVKDSVKFISDLPERELRDRARKTWEFANAEHTRESFAREYKRFVEHILSS